MVGFHQFNTMQGTTESAGIFKPSASLCSFLNVWWSLNGILEKKERPPRHTLSTYEFAANRQQQSSLCCLIQNHIDLCSFLFAPLSQHTCTHTRTHTLQPKPPTQAVLSQDRFQTVYRCQAHAENYSKGILLLNTNGSRLGK